MPIFHQGLLTNIDEMNVKEIIKFINKQKVAILSTVNASGTPRMSVVANLKGQSFEVMYFVTKINQVKVGNIINTPDIEVAFHDASNSAVFSGVARIIQDLEVKKQVWEDWMENFFPNGVVDESFVVIEFNPDESRILLD